MKIIHETGYSSEDCLHYRPVVYSNTIQVREIHEKDGIIRQNKVDFDILSGKCYIHVRKFT